MSVDEQSWNCDCKDKCIHEENFQKKVKELLKMLDDDDDHISNITKPGE